MTSQVLLQVFDRLLHIPHQSDDFQGRRPPFPVGGVELPFLFQARDDRLPVRRHHQEGLAPAHGPGQAGLVHHLPSQRQFRQRAGSTRENDVSVAALEQRHKAFGKRACTYLFYNPGIRLARPNLAGDADGVATRFVSPSRGGFH